VYLFISKSQKNLDLSSNKNSKIALAGFGRQKKGVRSHNSKKALTMPPERLRSLAIKQHLSGDVVSAEKGYQELVFRGVSDADVLSNYALICQESDRIEKALDLYEKCISLFPNHSFATSNLGYLYLSIGELEKAEATTRKAIELEPKLANSYSTLGLILKAKGNLEEAENEIQKAINLQPDFIDAYLNLGLILKANGKIEEAKRITKKAIEINPRSADAHLNLGTMLQDQGKLIEAEEITRKAIEIQQNIPDAHMNLGAILKDLGRIEKAVIYAQKEISISPTNQAAYLLLNSLLRDCELKEFSQEQIRFILKSLLPRTDINHTDLFRAISLLIPNKVLDELLKPNKNIFLKKEFNHMLADKEIVKGLRLLIFNNLLWERVLTKVRKNLCIEMRKGTLKKSKRLFEFTISLAEQCFLNEYVYNIEEEESEELKQLELSLPEEKVDEFKIALIACYEPISKLSKKLPSLINYKSSNDSFNELIELQLKEPEAEKEIANSLDRLGSIEDEISKKVRLQYEENPYPRWRFATHLNDNKLTIQSAVNNEIRPNRISYYPKARKSRVLIAGCGTGQQIFDADRYENAEITAIDLSTSSIAYAQRKVREYGVKNVKFIQMDILELEKLNRLYDIIECCGVLHHMESPSKGLSTLGKVLKNDGLIKLALYSSLAREDVIKARKIISSNNFDTTSNGIRLFRQSLIKGDFKEIQTLHQWSDFYTTSMCRDLCFHVKEHRYSLKQLESMLTACKLEFLGFVLDQTTKEKYALEFNQDKAQTDLQSWSQYEKRHPDTFRSMYQFWVKKACIN